MARCGISVNNPPISFSNSFIDTSECKKYIDTACVNGSIWLKSGKPATQAR